MAYRTTNNDQRYIFIFRQNIGSGKVICNDSNIGHTHKRFCNEQCRTAAIEEYRHTFFD